MGPSEQTTAPASASPPRRHPDAPPPGSPLGPHYAHCYGCGDQHAAGLHVQITAMEGVAVRAQFVVARHHVGAPGLAHGGVLATAMDEAFGSLAWLMRMPAVTGRLEIDYVRPVPLGATVVIDARCVGVDGRKVYVAAEARLDGPGRFNP